MDNIKNKDKDKIKKIAILFAEICRTNGHENNCDGCQFIDKKFCPGVLSFCIGELIYEEQKA